MGVDRQGQETGNREKLAPDTQSDKAKQPASQPLDRQPAI